MTAVSWLQLVALLVALASPSRSSATTWPRCSAAAALPAIGSSVPSSGCSSASPASTPTGSSGGRPTPAPSWPSASVSVLALYVLQRVQGSLPFNPTDAADVPPALAFNTAVSFVTNTNWQNYAAENTMSHLTQMMGLAVQNFVSAAVGLAVAVALIRGLVRRRSSTIGNFWVDLIRGVLRILLPIAFVAALVLVSQGVVQNLAGFEDATTVEGAAQVIPGGPAASQEAIKELGHERRRLPQRQLGPPVRQPERVH